MVIIGFTIIRMSLFKRIADNIVVVGEGSSNVELRRGCGNLLLDTRIKLKFAAPSQQKRLFKLRFNAL